MGMPTDIGVVDLMVGVPSDRAGWSKQYAGLLHDEESRGLRHGAGYMFKDLPDAPSDDYPSFLLTEMDRYGIERGLVPVSFDEPIGRALVSEHPGRFSGNYLVDPNKGMDEVRALTRAVEELGVIAAAFFPAGTFPQVNIDDARAYPIYAKCVELDIPICVNAGVPGPRFPMACQHVERLDVVCYDFPELRLVTRHGCEPWADLAVKLMLKWPNLYYSTVNFANTRGADKVMYAGYFPSGLSLERIFRELPDVPFRDEVWPKFLRENARRVFKLG